MRQATVTLNFQRTLRNSLLSIVLLVTGLPGALAAETAEAPDDAQRVYEMRTYTTNSGKLEALEARFRDHTMALFEKHGMQNVAYWIPLEQPDTLVYVISHRSREAAVASWKAFAADPEWQAVYQASIANGRLVKNIVSVFMVKTDFSP